MKNLALVLSFVTTLCFGQQAFKFQKLDNSNHSELRSKISRFNTYSANINEIYNHVSQQKSARQNISLQLTLDSTLLFTLEPNDIRDVSYQSVITGTDGIMVEPKENGNGIWYRGYVGNPKNTVRLTIKKDEISGSMKIGSRMLNIESIKDVTGNPAHKGMIIYDSKDVLDKSLACNANLVNSYAEKTGQSARTAATQTTYPIVRIATDADYSYYQLHKGIVNERILTLLNQVEGLYWTDFGVTFRVTFQNAYSYAADPYNSSDGNTLLNQFINYWNTNRQSVQRDLALLFYSGTVSISTGTIGGLATGGVCSNPYSAYALICTGTFETSTVAHEIAHLFGAGHDSTCTSAAAIMCATTIGGTFEFSTAAKTAISTYISTHTCLQSAASCYTLNKVGDTFSNPINLALPAEFTTLTRNTATDCYQNDFVSNASNNFRGQPSADIYYKIVTPYYGNLNITTCGSGVADTYLHLLSSSGTWITSNDDNGPLCSGTQASITYYANPGTYYVVAEGYGSYSGSITTSITQNSNNPVGASNVNPIEIGSLGLCGSYSDNKYNINPSYFDNYGNSGDDVWYKFTLTVNAMVHIANCNELHGFGLYLFNESLNPITTGSLGDCDNGSRIDMVLTSGTYYVVSEGEADGQYPFAYTLNTSFWVDCSPGRIAEPEIVTGISKKDVTADEVIIYPNPANDQLFIQNPYSTAGKLTILSVQGQVIADHQLGSGETTINVRHIPAGAYILEFNLNNKLRRKKFIIQR